MTREEKDNFRVKNEVKRGLVERKIATGYELIYPTEEFSPEVYQKYLSEA